MLQFVLEISLKHFFMADKDSSQMVKKLEKMVGKEAVSYHNGERSGERKVKWSIELDVSTPV